MATINVNNRSELQSALGSASGGETILLGNGTYGSVRISDDYASTLTVRAENPLGAELTGLTISGASNVRVDGVKVDSGVNGGQGGKVVSVENGSRAIEILNSEVTGKEDNIYVGHNGIYVNASTDVTLRGNNVHDVDNGIVVFGARDITVADNTIDYYANDAMVFGGVKDTQITNNISHGHVFPQSSSHNDFIQFQGTPSSDVVISGNVFLAGTIASSQGIFLNNTHFSDITIEDNIIYTGMLRGINVTSGDGITVRNNTLLNVPGEIHPGTNIFVPSGSTVEGNIVSAGSGGTSGSNITLQNTNPNGPYYVGDYFVNGAAGRGVTLDDLQPVTGSAAEAKGAIGRLTELLGGGSSAPAKPEPAPAPAPKPEVEQDAGAQDPDPIVGGSSRIVLDAGGREDAFGSGGKLFANKNASITGADDQAVYQTERYGNFDYSIPLENGIYDVTFRFAEIYFDSGGKRVFDVRAEDELVIENLDVFKAAGGKNVAYDETVAVEVTDGQLDLEFISVVENAKLSGIDIAPRDGFDFI